MDLLCVHVGSECLLCERSFHHSAINPSCSCLAVLVGPVSESVRCVIEQQEAALVQQVPSSNSEGIIFTRPAVFTPQLACALPSNSDVSTFIPQPSHTVSKVQYVDVFLFLISFSSLFIILSWPLHFHPPRLFLCSRFSCHILPTLSPSPLFLVSASALLLLSCPSWGVQCDGNGRVVLCLHLWCHTTAAL